MTHKTLTIRVPEEIAERLRSDSEAEHRSLNMHVLHLLEEATRNPSPYRIVHFIPHGRPAAEVPDEPVRSQRAG